MDKWTDGWVDGWMNERMNGRGLQTGWLYKRPISRVMPTKIFREWQIGAPKIVGGTKLSNMQEAVDVSRLEIVEPC